MFNKVLFPITFSLNIAQILENACFLKKFNVESIDLINVASIGFCSTDSCNINLQKAANIIKERTLYDVSTEFIEGHAASRIVYKAKKGNYDLIFIPANNKSIMTRTLLGSTASDVIRMTDTPTLIYKNYSSKPTNWATVIYPTDFKEAAERTKPYVKFLSRVASKLIIQHVGKRAADPRSETKRKKSIKEKLEDIKKDLNSSWSEIITDTKIGTPSKEIIYTAKKYNADLVIMGRGNTSFLKKLLGSTAERVSNSVESSVLLIP